MNKEVTVNIENVDSMKETKGATFSYCGETVVIRNVERVIVGFCNLNILEDIIRIEELDILENYQGQGYGKSFIKKLFIINPEVKTIKGQSKEEAYNFYIKLGATFETSCNECSYCECPYNSNWSGIEDENCTGVCDDYTEKLFTIWRKCNIFI